MKKTAHGPMSIDGKNGPVVLCMCGLSKNQPFCDGSHLKTLDEDESKTYCYSPDGKREECTCEYCK